MRSLPDMLWMVSVLDWGLFPVDYRLIVQRTEWAGQSTLLKMRQPDLWAKTESVQSKATGSWRELSINDSCQDCRQPAWQRSSVPDYTESMCCARSTSFRADENTKQMRTCEDTALVRISLICIGFKPWYENGFCMKMRWWSYRVASWTWSREDPREI